MGRAFHVADFAKLTDGFFAYRDLMLLIEPISDPLKRPETGTHRDDF